MTVGLGLVCKDGVIVASDSMGSNQMIAVKSIKVFSFGHNPVIWTSAGSVFVKEEVEATIAQRLDDAPKDFFTVPKTLLIRGKVRDAVHPTVLRCYQSALSTTAYSPGSTAASYMSEFLILGYANGTPWFLEMASDGQFNWHTDERFYAIGSGGPFATVCHALMKHYISDDLSTEQGLRLAYRAIETTYEVSSGFVGPPVQLAIVDDAGARVLGEDEVRQIGLAVDRWKLLEADTLRDIATSPEEIQKDLPSMDESGDEVKEQAG